MLDISDYPKVVHMRGYLRRIWGIAIEIIVNLQFISPIVIHIMSSLSLPKCLAYSTVPDQ